jgi:glucose dehydrogenase
MMKKLSKAVLSAALLALVSLNVQAQDFTDQDLKDYAIILLAQKSITDKITPAVESYIAKQEGIDNNRFVELDNIAKGNVAKLNGTDATDFEKTFYKTMQDRVVAKKKKAAQTVVSQLATHSLGAKKYNAIKKAYASGGDAKSKVDALMAELVEKP